MVFIGQPPHLPLLYILPLRPAVFRVVLLLVALARFFKVEKEVAVALSAELQSNEVNVPCEAYICDRLRSSLQILGRCESEEQRSA